MHRFEYVPDQKEMVLIASFMDFPNSFLGHLTMTIALSPQILNGVAPVTPIFNLFEAKFEPKTFSRNYTIAAC